MSLPTPPVDHGVAELEAALRDLGRALSLPVNDGFAGRVRQRIEADPPTRARRPWWWSPARRPADPRARWAMALAATALLVTAAVMTAAIGFGLPGIRILVGPSAASSTEAGGSVPSRPPGATLGLGTPLSLQRAQALVAFPILLPSDPAIGRPDGVYLASRRVTLTWAPGPGRPGTADPTIGLLLVELRALPDEILITKLIDANTTVERVAVDGGDGYWISGAPHVLAYLAPDGTRIEDATRTSGTTLVWTLDGVTYRLEGEFDRDEAIRLAASLR
jgi:hypothetical protein